MTNQLHYKFYFNRRHQTMETFLAGIYNLPDALLKFDDSSLFGYDIEEVTLQINKNLEKKNLAKSTPKKTASKKAVSKKTAVSKNRKPRTRRKKPVKTAKENSGGKKEDDSGYFETWKVPYVEP